MKITITKNQLKAALFCSAKKDIRYYLNSIYIEKTESGATYIVATDGVKMFVGELTQSDSGALENIIIPRDTIELVLKTKLDYILLDSEAKVMGGIQFTPIDAKYPDFRRVIPQNRTEEQSVSVFNPEELLACHKALNTWDETKNGFFKVNQWDNSSAYMATSSAFCVIMPIREDKALDFPLMQVNPATEPKKELEHA